jgi:hypothetical protein
MRAVPRDLTRGECTFELLPIHAAAAPLRRHPKSVAAPRVPAALVPPVRFAHRILKLRSGRPRPLGARRAMTAGRAGADDARAASGIAAAF